MFAEGVLDENLGEGKGGANLKGMEKHVRYAFNEKTKIFLSVTSTETVNTSEALETFITSERAFMHAVKGAFSGVPDKVLMMVLQALSEKLNDSFDERGRIIVSDVPIAPVIDLNQVTERDSLLNLSADEHLSIPAQELEVTEMSIDDFNSAK